MGSQVSISIDSILEIIVRNDVEYAWEYFLKSDFTGFVEGKTFSDLCEGFFIKESSKMFSFLRFSIMKIELMISNGDYMQIVTNSNLRLFLSILAEFLKFSKEKSLYCDDFLNKCNDHDNDYYYYSEYDDGFVIDTSSSLYNRLWNLCVYLLFVNGFSVSSDDQPWILLNDLPNASMNRKSVIKCIINLTMYNESFIITDFPLEDIYVSICNLTTDFVHSYEDEVVNEVDKSLLKVSYVLLSILFLRYSSFEQDMSSINGNYVLNSLHGSISNSNPIVLSSKYPLYIESMTYVYVSLMSVPYLVQSLGESGCSNSFIASLLRLFHYTLTISSLNYFHTILISCILKIIENSLCAVSLNAPYLDQFDSTLCAHRGSYADLLIEILLTYSHYDVLVSSIVSVLHQIAYHINDTSLFISCKILAFFETLIGNGTNSSNIKVIDLFLEFLARTVQRTETCNQNLCLMIVTKAKLFKSLHKTHKMCTESLNRIISYVNYIRKRIQQVYSSKNIESDLVLQIILQTKTEEIFFWPKEFENHPHVFGGKMEEQWIKWNLVFIK